MTWTAEQATQELLQDLAPAESHGRRRGARGRGQDTTMAQFRVLAQLARNRTLSVLAKWRRVSLQSMSGLVQALVERGWVERMPDPRDRRRQLLQLTARGHEHYQQAQVHILHRLHPLMAALSPAELERGGPGATRAGPRVRPGRRGRRRGPGRGAARMKLDTEEPITAAQALVTEAPAKQTPASPSACRSAPSRAASARWPSATIACTGSGRWFRSPAPGCSAPRRTGW